MKALIWTMIVMAAIAVIFWWDMGFWVYEIFDGFFYAQD